MTEKPRDRPRCVTGIPAAANSRTTGTTRPSSSSAVTRTAPGQPHSEQRQRFLVRLARRVLRTLGQHAGLGGITARGRDGAEWGDITIAFRWWRQGTGQAMGEALGPLLESLWATPEQAQQLFEAAAQTVREADPGRRPNVIRPTVAVSWFVGFAAHALHRWPDDRERLRAGGAFA